MKSKQRLTRRATLVVGLSLVAGCGGPASDGPELVRLAVNPWTGSAVNAAVAKAVIERVGIGQVEIVDIDENATWPAISTGDKIDGVLEVWPSGHAADYERYVTKDKSVIDAGPLGPEAKVGWYVPKFVIDEHPELATWEGLKDPKNAALFATPTTASLGQFLMGDPTYVSFDEQIIANLGLPLKFVAAGDEVRLISAMQAAFRDRRPILVQFWRPHWLQTRLDLVEVALPAITDACRASAASDPSDGRYACEYPVDGLYKALNAKLAKRAPKSVAVLKQMVLTTEQQSSIAALIDADGMTPDAAAAKWVDENEATWKAWLT